MHIYFEQLRALGWLLENNKQSIKSTMQAAVMIKNRHDTIFKMYVRVINILIICILLSMEVADTDTVYYTSG